MPDVSPEALRLARVVVASWEIQGLPDEQTSRAWLVQMIAAELDAAVAAERERCARLLELNAEVGAAAIRRAMPEPVQ